MISNIYMFLMRRKINEAKIKLAEQANKAQKELDEQSKEMAKAALKCPGFVNFLLKDYTENKNEDTQKNIKINL